MNKEQVKNILSQVNKGEEVKYNDLRATAKAVGITVASKKPDIVAGLKDYIAKTQKPKAQKPKVVSVKKGSPGRPKAKPEDLVGYKVKIGLRYPTEDGTLTKLMRDGAVYKTTDEAQTVVDQLVKSGEIRVWGGTVRAKFIPRYNSKK